MLEVIVSAIMSFIGTNIDDLFVDTIFFAGVDSKLTSDTDLVDAASTDVGVPAGTRTKKSADWNAKAQVRSIVIGKYLGIGALVLVSLLGAFGLQLLPGKYIGLLGLVPMGLGIKAAIEYYKERKTIRAKLVLIGDDTSELQSGMYGDGVDKAENLESETGTNKSEEATHIQKHRSLLLSVTLVTIANGADNIGVYIPLFAGYRLWQLGVLVCVFAVMIAVWCLIAKRLADLPLLRRVLIKYKGVIVPVVFLALGVYIMVENFWL